MNWEGGMWDLPTDLILKKGAYQQTA